jgi:hypothetical protein
MDKSKNPLYMRLLIIYIVLAVMVSCSLMPPRRQYLKEVKHQTIPKEILNTTWALESFDNKAPDCPITMTFLERGQFTFQFKGELYEGDNLYYLVKDGRIEFHTRPLEKIVWTLDECEMNPNKFALYIQGPKKVNIENDRLKFQWIGKELIFIKV